jgi:hypothetical protein
VQLTIDSAEPLEKVLAVIGALYNVEVATTAAAPAARQKPRAANAARSRRATTGPARRASVAKPDPASVRAWAKTTGLEVNDRGRVPANVTAAYVAAGAPTD